MNTVTVRALIQALTWVYQEDTIKIIIPVKVPMKDVLKAKIVLEGTKKEDFACQALGNNELVECPAHTTQLYNISHLLWWHPSVGRWVERYLAFPDSEEGKRTLAGMLFLVKEVYVRH